ncbi:MAG: phosphomethylpyrimidine synthase ThiC [Methanoregulaceae archaeon]|nr:phosphomethylpyrimidine synthase ThiC [Methanoregulaceae archaeon]
MYSLIEKAQQGTITPEIRAVAAAEGIRVSLLREHIAEGSAVIMQRGECLVGIGTGLRTKINVNLGTSPGKSTMTDEMEKARIAGEFGADTISDLSMGGDIDAIRREILSCTTLPITTIPIYQAAAEIGLHALTSGDIIASLKKQVDSGISSCVIHGVSRAMLDAFHRKRRTLGMVSKGGSITSAFMLLNRCENPYLEHFDEVISVCRKHNIVLSLGNTMRSGCIHDPRDMAQIEEIRQNVRLAGIAHEKGVQVIIEGAGGHIRMDRISSSVKYYKRQSRYPLFVAGPLPTDIGLGYDHLAGCVGASIASAAGADYLCAVTPSEHLGLPGPGAVREGLIAFRIAAHIGDISKYGQDNEDLAMAVCRAALDREGQIRRSLDPVRTRELANNETECTMCGNFCAIRIMREFS